MFAAAIAYLDAYRKGRCAALNNLEPQRWFTDDVDTLGELFDDPFDPSKENAALAKLYAQDKVDVLKLKAAQMQLDVVAGLRHDLRVQFAVQAEHDGRTALDYDRHGLCDHACGRRKFDDLKQAVEVQSKGGKSV